MQATADAPQARRTKQDANSKDGGQDAGGVRGEGGETRKNKDEDASDERDGNDSDAARSSADVEIALMELVVRPEASLIGRSAMDLALRTRYGLNLLAVSRNGQRSKSRLRTMKIQAGDLLLMQGPLEALAEFAADSGCVPLAERELRIPDRRKA